MPRFLSGLALILLTALPVRAVLAQAPASVPAPAAASVTPAQAAQALEVLQDDKKRAQLIATLETIAHAASPPASSPAKAASKPHPAHGLGAQLLAQGSEWLHGLSDQVAALARSVTDFPSLKAWIERLASDPGTRYRLLDAAWRFAVVFGCALAGEWLARLGLRRSMAMLRDAAGRLRAPSPPFEAAEAAPVQQARLRHVWRGLRLVPFALARLIVDLLPVLVFAAAANLLVGFIADKEATARLVTLALVNAYALCRAVMCATRMAVSPDAPALRPLPVSDETAAYVEVWMRRVVVVVVFGLGFAEAALLLGLDPDAHDALVKLVMLVAHLLLVVLVLQSRRGVANWIAAADGSRGVIALMRRRVADLWHLAAIAFLVGSWAVWAAGLQNGFLVMLHYILVTAAVLAVARVATVVALGALDRLFRINADFVHRYPGLEARANRYYPLLRATVSGILAAISVLALLEVWGLDAIVWFRSGTVGDRLLSAVVTIAVTVAAAVVIWEAANAAIERHMARLGHGADMARTARLRTLLPMLRTALLITIIVVVGMTVLSQIGVNIGPLLAGAGIVGVAIGFGSQKLVQDLITGMFLLLENAMQVGDWVTAAGLSGTVEDLSIRTMRLRAGDGSVHIVPFSSVSTVTNNNKGLGNAAVSVTVDSGEDTDRVGRVLGEIAAEMRKEPGFARGMLSDFQLWGVDKVDASTATIVGQIVCIDTARWGVQREFNRRLKIRFHELGIAIANPAQAVLLLEADDAARRGGRERGRDEAGPEAADEERGARPQGHDGRAGGPGNGKGDAPPH